jgi:alpha-tubulin suppressor-like RCC1 family protein
MAMNSAIPAQVAGGHVFTSISAGGSHTCAATPQNEIYCWGTGSSGQLGIGSLVSQLVPVKVEE